jgi:leukotriene-A4 hydrolase
VTPTLLAGDRSLANVVAHEIAHSWTGNLVTNASWNDFWLNEGWTVFLERKILQRRSGDATWAFHAAGGWMDLKDEVRVRLFGCVFCVFALSHLVCGFPLQVARLGAEHPYTRLVHDLSDGAVWAQTHSCMMLSHPPANTHPSPHATHVKTGSG